MARVLFINPSTRHHGTCLTVYPPLGVLSLSATLREAGHEVKFLDADIEEVGLVGIQRQVMDFVPQVVGITMNTLQSKSALEIAEAIKRADKNAMIAVGGPHPSALKDEILNSCRAIDAVVYGEGEATTTELVRAVEEGRSLEGIKGVCFREEGGVMINPPREPIEDLDSLPRPALDLAMPIRKYPGSYPVGARPTIQIMASRGCPFHCTFCSNAVWGRRLRVRSPESILEEIEDLEKDYKVREVFFQDDTFNMNRDWFEAICNGLIERGLNEKMVFRAPFRANERLVDRDMLKLAKQAGFWMIFYGVESGSQEILDSIKKNLKKEEIERAFSLTKKAGIKTYASFMIGNLGEDRKTVRETMDFALKLNPDFYGFAMATPYPGSELYEVAQKDGLIKSGFEGYALSSYVMDGGGLSPQDVEELVQEAHRLMENRRSSWLYRLEERLNAGHRPLERHFDYYPVKEPDIELLGTEITMGETDQDVLGSGWYALENWPPRIRWTERRATAFLKRESSSRKLCIRTVTSVDGLALMVYGNGKLARKFEIGTQWMTYQFSLEGISAEVIRLDLESDKPWVPDELLGNGDRRSLGVAVEKIWQEP